MTDPVPLPDAVAEDAFRALDLENAARRVREATSNTADALKVEVGLFVIARGQTLLPEERGVLLDAALSKILPENREKMSALLDQRITRWQSLALSDYTKAEETRRDADPIGDPVPPVEGNGKHKPKRKAKSHPVLSEMVAALGRVEEGNPDSPDPSTCFESVMPHVLSGDLAEEVARAALVGAYPAGGDAMFDAAMEKARTNPSAVPPLSHKTPQRSAIAFVKHLYTKGEVRTLHQFQELYFRWDGTAYRIHGAGSLRGEVWKFLPLGGMDPNSARVSNVVDGINAEIGLMDTLEPTCWLGPKPEGYPDPKDIVPLRNGLLHPQTGELMAHDPRLFNLSALPFDYTTETATPPKVWLRFLSDLWPDDQQSIDTLQEIFGYLLTSDISLHKMFFLQGPPRSGKSTVAEILTALLGSDNCAAPSLDSMAGEHGLQALRGKTAAIISEASISAKTDATKVVNTLKRISGGDPVTINPKFKDEVKVTLRVRFFMQGNDIPRFIDASGALHSRFILLCLKESWLGREDLTLKDRLLVELPQILHWALEGRQRLYAKVDEEGRSMPHFIIPDSAREVMEELEDAASPVSAFIKERCVKGMDEHIEAEALWAMWEDWSRRNGKDAGAQAWFGRDLRAACPRLLTRKERRGNVRVKVYHGIGKYIEAP